MLLENFKRCINYINSFNYPKNSEVLIEDEENSFIILINIYQDTNVFHFNITNNLVLFVNSIKNFMFFIHKDINNIEKGLEKYPELKEFIVVNNYKSEPEEDQLTKKEEDYRDHVKNKDFVLGGMLSSNIKLKFSNHVMDTLLTNSFMNELDRLFGGKTTNKRTSVRNRRYNTLYIPKSISKKNEGFNYQAKNPDQLDIFLDCSGSMTLYDETLARNILERLKTRYKTSKINIHTFSTDVYETVNNILVWEGGGTLFQPVMDYIKEHDPKTSIIISDMLFGDLYNNYMIPDNMVLVSTSPEKEIKRILDKITTEKTLCFIPKEIL